MVFVLMASNANATNWEEPYTPTRKEWIELSLIRKITNVTELWNKRVAVNVVLFTKENTLAIVLASPNGQQGITPTICNRYSDIVRIIAETHIKENEWASGIKIDIRCA
jgi:hypothetical protein